MSEIKREVARALVGQFTAFSPLPQADEGLTLTINTLIASARSEAHARAIVREIVDAPGDPPKWPSPDRIRAVAWALLTESEKAIKCGKCGGSGFIHTVRIVGGVPLDCSGPCSCRVVPQPAPDQKSRGIASAAAAMEDFRW